MTSLLTRSWIAAAVVLFFVFNHASADSTGSNAPTSYGLIADSSMIVPNPAPLNQGMLRWSLGDVAGGAATYGNDTIQGNNGANLGHRWTALTGFIPYRTYILTTSTLEGCSGQVNFQVMV